MNQHLFYVKKWRFKHVKPLFTSSPSHLYMRDAINGKCVNEQQYQCFLRLISHCVSPSPLIIVEEFGHRNLRFLAVQPSSCHMIKTLRNVCSLELSSISCFSPSRVWDLKLFTDPFPSNELVFHQLSFQNGSSKKCCSFFLLTPLICTEHPSWVKEKKENLVVERLIQPFGQ